MSIDLKELLYQDLILREKDLREFVKTHKWSDYQGKYVAIYCSADAIIPTWAFMLIAVALEPFAKKIHFGNESSMMTELFRKAMSGIDWETYRNAKVVIKGCGKVHVPESAYVDAAASLRPVAASIFYGEPCSTVPLYKKPK